MAPRTFWKGYLKLSLVTCPVTMAPATTESERVRFHTLNRATGNRVVSRYVDSVTRATVEEDDEVKGYEHGQDQYVMLEDDEIDAVGLESTRTIDIEVFVDRESIEWIWFDTPHYLTPSDRVGQEAFAVIRAAMEKNGVVGIARLVMYRRERAVMLEPRDNGIVLWTLRFGDEVRDVDDYFTDLGEAGADARQLELMQSFISKNTSKWNPAILEDPVQDRLLALIAEKKKAKPGKKAKAPPKPPAPKEGNVINIMDALRKSLGKTQ